MPTYDYVCDACGHEFEEFQSFSAKHLKKCPECGKNKLRRLIGTGAGVIFKGSGFYETDYRSKGYEKDAKADKDSGKGDKKSDSSASDKKEKKEKTSSDSSSSTAGSDKPKPKAGSD